MGLGSFPAGFGPAGADVPTTTAARAPIVPSAPKFNGLTLDFEQAANNDFAQQHPIDAKYFNRLRIAAGSIRSAVDLGQGISNLEWIDPRTIVAFCSDQVNQVSGDMIDAGEIQVHGITVDTAVRSRVGLEVDYTNLKTGKRQTLKP